MKSSGSRQNSETRTEPFPKPRPQPIFPRRVRLHVPHTYNRWNAHHISGPCSYSAACAFQLWCSIVFPTRPLASLYAQYFLTAQYVSIRHLPVHACGILWYILKPSLYVILTPCPFILYAYVTAWKEWAILVNGATFKDLTRTSGEPIFRTLFFLASGPFILHMWHYFWWKALKEYKHLKVCTFWNWPFKRKATGMETYVKNHKATASRKEQPGSRVGWCELLKSPLVGGCLTMCIDIEMWCIFQRCTYKNQTGPSKMQL